MWYFQNRPIRSLQDVPDQQHVIGFCYKITNLVTGKIYIGKKQLYSIAKKKPRLTFQKRRMGSSGNTSLKESNWKKYFGSSKELTADVQKLGTSSFHREILGFCKTKKMMTYLEAKYQFMSDVLSNGHYNANILGRFFSKDVEGLNDANFDNQVPTGSQG